MVRITTLLAITLAGVALASAQAGPPDLPGGQARQGRRPGGAPGAATGATPAPPPVAADNTELTPSITHHTGTFNGTPVKYTATVAQIPLKGDTGEVECRMSYVSYTKDDADDSTRPVTFAFNGGPGSATLWLHMGTVGPKRAPMNDDGSLPAPPYSAVDNNDSWLDFTDAVCIDAPATGFGRLTKPEFATRYFGVQPDIAAFTEFVREWLTIHHRWRSPLFIAGESYGGIRGSGLSASLWRSGIAVNGFVSISGTSNFLTLDGMRGNDATYIGFLPSMAACAYYHHKLPAKYTSPDQVVAEVQKWIDTDYAAALERGDSLSPADKDRIAGRMSMYLGISKKYILGLNLRVPERLFFRELLRDESLTIGRYDGRLVGREELGVGERSSGDPSDEATSAPFTSSINDYFTRELGVKTELRYQNMGNVRPWTEPEGSYAETASQLVGLIERNKNFQVLYCCGYYDLACPLNATVFTVNHMGLSEEARKQISFAYFPAGHMMYIDKDCRKKLHDDIKAFEARVLGQH